MTYIGTREAARRLNISIERVQQLIRLGILPAIRPAHDYLINESDLKFAKRRRKPGRPPKERTA